MKAWLCETLDGIGSMHYRELPTPEPQAGEVRIAIRAASLNFNSIVILRLSRIYLCYKTITCQFTISST